MKTAGFTRILQKYENQIIMDFMPESHITVTEASRHFAEIIGRVRFEQEQFVLEKGGKPVAMISPYPGGGTAGQLAKLLPTLPRLGKEDAERFSADLEEIR